MLLFARPTSSGTSRIVAATSAVFHHRLQGQTLGSTQRLGPSFNISPRMISFLYVTNTYYIVVIINYPRSA